MAEDNQGELSYNGEKPEEWAKAISDINKLAIEIYPTLLEKKLDGSWKRVHPDFPDVAGILPNELDPGYNAFEFVRKNQTQINTEKCNREETRALDVVQTTHKFMEIMVARVKIYDLYGTVINELTELSTKECNGSVHLLRLKHKRAADTATKETLEEDIMQKFSEYEEIKSKVQETLKLFKTASSCLAKDEGLVFNRKFNRNEYINYWRLMEEYKIRGVTIEVYLQDQEALWTDALSSLADKPATQETQEKMSGLEAMMKALAESLSSNKKEDQDRSKKREVERVNRKYSVFQELCKDAKDLAEDAGLEELQSTASELRSLQRELKESQFNPDIDMSVEAKEFIERKSSLIKTLFQRIEVLKMKKEDEETKRKNEVSANLRSMESIKLLPLTGAEDFIAWKKNQVRLNSHTDPYKKAAALLSTIKNHEDRQMLINIDDWAKMLTLLNEKYNHNEKLVPALKNKLEGLPKAQTDEQMLNNHRTTINIYEQLCAMGCKENFDGTVVYNLQQKMTSDGRKNFERYKLRRKEMEAMQQDPNYTFNVTDISEASVDITTNPQDLKVVDNSPEVRRLFLLFIKEESKLLEFTKEETSKVEVSRSELHANNLRLAKNCPVCGSDEAHLNNFNKPTSSIGRCPVFRDMTIDERKECAKMNKACFICLVPGHSTKKCSINSNCKKCKNAKHHPLLCGRYLSDEMDSNNVDDEDTEDDDAAV